MPCVDHSTKLIEAGGTTVADRRVSAPAAAADRASATMHGPTHIRAYECACACANVKGQRLSAINIPPLSYSWLGLGRAACGAATIPTAASTQLPGAAGGAPNGLALRQKLAGAFTSRSGLLDAGVAPAAAGAAAAERQPAAASGGTVGRLSLLHSGSADPNPTICQLSVGTADAYRDISTAHRFPPCYPSTAVAFVYACMPLTSCYSRMKEIQHLPIMWVAISHVLPTSWTLRV